MSEKMLTLEEALLELGAPTGSPGSLITGLWKLARQGMAQKVDEAGYLAWLKVHMYPQSDEGYRELWGCAQAALLADPLVLDLRGVEWPTVADRIVPVFRNDLTYVSELQTIYRPTTAWRPKYGDDVLIGWENGNVTHFVWCEGSSEPTEGVLFIAAARSMEERKWTKEQFLARGECWVVE
jgi:hypothetical protein